MRDLRKLRTPDSSCLIAELSETAFMPSKGRLFARARVGRLRSSLKAPSLMSLCRSDSERDTGGHKGRGIGNLGGALSQWQSGSVGSTKERFGYDQGRDLVMTGRS